MLMSQDVEQSSLTDSPMAARRKQKMDPKSFSSGDQVQPPVPYIPEGLPGGDKSSFSKSGEKIHAPRKVDVLLGRGKPFQSHPGNQRMLRFVDEYRTRYLRAERREKHAIVESVMKMIMESGGRFLSRVDYENYWVEVTHSIAYRKVGHAFRSKARRSGDGTGSQNGSDTEAVSDIGPDSSSRDRAGAGTRTRHDLLLTGAAGMLTGRNSPSMRSHLSEAPVSAHLAVAQQLGASLNSRAPSLQVSGEINPRIPYPPPRLAMDLQLPLQAGQMGGFAGSSAGMSSFAAPSPAALAGGMLPSTTFEPALMYHQRQQLLAQQQQQQILSRSRNMDLMLRGDQALQNSLARAQLIESLRRRSHLQGGDQEQQPSTQRYPPFY